MVDVDLPHHPQRDGTLGVHTQLSGLPTSLSGCGPVRFSDTEWGFPGQPLQ